MTLTMYKSDICRQPYSDFVFEVTKEKRESSTATVMTVSQETCHIV